MKVVISNYDDLTNPYYAGGGAIAIHEVAKRLAKKHEIIIITGNYKGAVEKTINSVHYKRIGFSRVGPKFGQLLFQFYLPFFARTMKYDLWIESFTPPFSTAFLPLFTKKPVIGLTHLLGGKEKSKEYKLPFYLIENLGLKTYKYFIVLTNGLKKKIGEINTSAYIDVIPNGVNIKDFTPKKRSAKHILFLGRVAIYQKGLDILLNAYKKANSNLAHKLLIAGDGTKEDIEELVSLIRLKGLEKEVKYIGKIEGEKKYNLINESLFIVMPSRYENYPLVLLESFSMGKPVILFDTEGVKWVPDDYCLKVKPFDETKFAEGMVKLAKNTLYREAIAKKEKRYAMNFDWEAIAQQYIAFIDRVTTKKGDGNENINHSRILSAK